MISIVPRAIGEGILSGERQRRERRKEAAGDAPTPPVERTEPFGPINSTPRMMGSVGAWQATIGSR